MFLAFVRTRTNSTSDVISWRVVLDLKCDSAETRDSATAA